MNTPYDGWDSRILKWAGAALFAFLVGSFVVGAGGGPRVQAAAITGRAAASLPHVQNPCATPSEG
jgi:hypothetical protein